MTTLSTKQTGDIGEGIACTYLGHCGYEVIERNHWQKWGEIDVIASKVGVVHFVEVKTVSHETVTELISSVSRRTWRPEEQVHAEKLKRMHRVVETWLQQHAYDGAWQIDVLSVRIVPRETYAAVNLIQNIT